MCWGEEERERDFGVEDEPCDADARKGLEAACGAVRCGDRWRVRAKKLATDAAVLERGQRSRPDSDGAITD